LSSRRRDAADRGVARLRARRDLLGDRRRRDRARGGQRLHVRCGPRAPVGVAGGYGPARPIHALGRHPRAVSQTSEALSSAAGGWLYAMGPRWPFWLQVPTALLALVTATMLRETPRRGPADARCHTRRALHILGFTLWHHRRLRAAMALSVALGLSTFVVIWLIQSYMQARGIHTAWFGPLWAVAHVWLAAASLSSAPGAATPRLPPHPP